MSLIGLDLGGTKIAAALFAERGEPTHRESVALESRSGPDVGALLVERVRALLDAGERDGGPAEGVGIAVPGIYRAATLPAEARRESMKRMRKVVSRRFLICRPGSSPERMISTAIRLRSKSLVRKSRLPGTSPIKKMRLSLYSYLSIFCFINPAGEQYRSTYNDDTWF